MVDDRTRRSNQRLMKKVALVGLVLCALAGLVATQLSVGPNRDCDTSGERCDARARSEAKALGALGGLGIALTLGAGIIWYAEKE